MCARAHIYVLISVKGVFFLQFFVEEEKKKKQQCCINLLSHHKHHIIKQNMHYYRLEFNFNNREFDCGRENYAVLCINTHTKISVAYHKLFAQFCRAKSNIGKLEMQLVVITF